RGPREDLPGFQPPGSRRERRSGPGHRPGFPRRPRRTHLGGGRWSEPRSEGRQLRLHPPDRGRGPLKMARVLVIDDDKALLRALRVALSAKGHEVLVAATAEDGLASLALRAPEVVVLDLGLPDLDGLEVVRRIRSWSDVP